AGEKGEDFTRALIKKNAQKDNARWQKVDEELETLRAEHKSLTGGLQVLEGGNKGEFFYEVVDIQPTNISNEVVDFSKVKPIFESIIAPETSKFFRDVNGLFGPEDSLKLGAIDDMTAAIKDKVRRIDKTLMNKKLSQADQNAATRLLARGAGEGRVIPYEEARAGNDVYHGTSEAAYESYLAKRNQSDYTYVSSSHRMYEDLTNKGYNLLTEVDGEYTFGVKLEGSDNVTKNLLGVHKVLDMNTGHPIALTSAMKSDLKIRKSFMYRLRAEERIDDAVYQYMYVDANAVTGVKDVPPYPLKYIDGYVYRKHLDRYFVEVVEKVSVNGSVEFKSKAVVRGAADTPAEAKELVKHVEDEFLSDNMRAAGATVRFRYGREMVKDMSTSEASFEMARVAGLIHSGKRGPLLDKEGGELANLRSTHEALQSSIAQASSFMQEVPLVEALEREFAEYFGNLKLIGFNNEGGFSFPLKSQHILDTEDPAMVPVRNQAVAAWDYINMVGRYQDPVSKWYRGKMLKLGIGFDNVTGGSLGHKVGGFVGQKDPLDLLRTNAFIQFIATNPFRQMPLQAAQHLILAPLAPTYVGTGRALKDSMATMTGAIIRHDDDAWRRYAPAAAKFRGLSLEEFGAEVDAWLDTGMMQSVDSHQMLQAIMPDSLDLTGMSVGGKAVSGTLNAMSYPIRLAQSLGFNVGEIANLAATWHTLRYKNAKEGIEMSPLELGQRARQMALSMTHAGSYGYQAGALKETMQFQSFQHKMTAAMLGDNPAFTKPQRASILAVQSLSYGAKGIGFGALGMYITNSWEEQTGTEIPLYWKQALLEGFGTLYVNEGIKLAAEAVGLEPEDYENTFISFSSFAPLSGSTFATGTIFDLIFGSKTLWETVIGPGGVALTRLSDTLGQVQDIFFARDPLGEKDEVQVMLKSLDIISRGLSSGMSNYHKGRIAAEVGSFIDKQDDIVVKTTLLEAWAKALAGLGSYDEYVYRQHQNDTYFREREEEEQVRKDVSAMMHLSDARVGGERSTRNKLTKLNELIIHTKFASDEYGERYRLSFMKEYLNKVETRNGQKDLFQDVMSEVTDQHSLRQVYAKLLSLTPEGEERETMRGVLDALLIKEPTRNLFEQDTQRFLGEEEKN
ncbi:MAG: hypothetical protein DRI24_15820, partial [Deltaproteobacteria bacterium]